MSFQVKKIHQRQCPYDIARYSHCAVFYNDELFIHGGQLDGPNMDYCDKLYAFNMTSHEWRLIPCINRPEFRRNHTTTLWRHYMYLYGGCGTWEIIKLNDMWVFDFETCKWEIVTARESVVDERAIVARTRHSAHTYGDSMIVFGGNITVNENEENTNETYDFNYTSSDWKIMQVSGKTPNPRHSHASIVNGHRMYIFGGRDVLGNRFNDLYCLDLRNKAWREIITCGDVPSPRAGVNLMVSGHLMYLFGGFDGNHFFSDVFSVDLKKGKWSKVLMNETDSSTFCKAYYTTCQDGHRWIHFGGAGETGEKMDDLFVVEFTDPTFDCFKRNYLDTIFVFSSDFERE